MSYLYLVIFVHIYTLAKNQRCISYSLEMVVEDQAFYVKKSDDFNIQTDCNYYKGTFGNKVFGDNGFVSQVTNTQSKKWQSKYNLFECFVQSSN